jgi:hypothetical protein
MSVTDATPEQIDRGLQALVEAGGNSRKASEKSGIPDSTLRSWKHAQPEKYRRMELSYFDELEDATRSRAQEVAHTASDLEADLLQKVREQIPRMDGKDAATAARAVADVKAKAINTWTSLSDRNPEGSREPDDGWEMIAAGVRKGYLKLSPQLEGLMDDAPDGSS